MTSQTQVGICTRIQFTLQSWSVYLLRADLKPESQSRESKMDKFFPKSGEILMY